MRHAIQEFYRGADDHRRYSMDDAGRVAAHEEFYKTNRRSISGPVLDLACGGGILGFILERHRIGYTGVDINPDMIAAARRHARKVGSRAAFVLGDATRIRRLPRSRTVTLLGNALCHLSTRDVAAILRRVTPLVPTGGRFFVDYRDVVGLLFRREWRAKMVITHKGRRIISYTRGCDTERGVIIKEDVSATTHTSTEFTHGIWSPFILEPLMLAHGWRLVERVAMESWQGWAEEYRRARVGERFK